MKGCDLVVKLLRDDFGIDTYFVLTGGAIVPFIDALGRTKGITVIPFQHEQGATMAAEGYWRECGKLAPVVVTSGPGVQNTFNGICGCYYDSVPLLVIAGQVNTSEGLSGLRTCKPRQRGFQEMPVVECFSPFCVYAKQLRFSADLHETIVKYFSEAVIAATTPRFGPAILDWPVNLQMIDIRVDEKELSRGGVKRQKLTNAPREDGAPSTSSRPSTLPVLPLSQKISTVTSVLKQGKRPLILFGAGVRASGSASLAQRLVAQLGLPFVLSWGAKDLFEHSHPLNLECHGVYGVRSANFAVQNCDCLLVLGSRLDTRQTGGNLPMFSPTSIKIMVDVDPHEVDKLIELGVEIKHPIITELHEFLSAFVAHLENGKANELAGRSRDPDVKSWIAKLQQWRATYAEAQVDAPMRVMRQDPGPALSVYDFLSVLDTVLPTTCTIIPSGYGAWAMQTLKAKEGQRIYTNLGNASMGFAGPCSIGSAIGAKQHTGRPTIIIDGDGGFMMNIQELKTVVDKDLPIKTIILNNGGYGIIKQFQELYFDSRWTAVNFPRVDFVAQAQAYGMHAVSVSADDDVPAKLKAALAHPGPVLIDVMIQQYQKIYPKLEFGNALEHQTPFVPLGELEKEFEVPVLERKEPKGWVHAKA